MVMTTRAHRWILAVLALSGLFVAAWALPDPHSFYESFPGFGRHWVRVDGPYNEHLVRDVGAFYLALAVLSALAMARPEELLVRATGLAWVAFSVPHLAYHATHLGHFGTFDKIANVIALGGTLLLAVALLVPSRVNTAAGRGPALLR